jgi:hypothetical protein
MNAALRRTLQISDLGLEIDGPAGWVERLGQTWAGWTADAVPDRWSIRLDVGPAVDDDDSPFVARPYFEDGVCYLTATGFSGQIDPGAGTGCLQAHPRASKADLAGFVRTCFAFQAFQRGGIAFHAAGVIHGGRGYALFGPSGAGKSTVAEFSVGDVILNDDLILIKRGNSGWQMWATPFSTSWLPQPRQGPLHALLRLKQAEEDRLEPMGPGVVLAELIASSQGVNAYAAWLPALFDRWQLILGEAPVQALHFRRGPAFWRVIDAEFG